MEPFITALGCGVAVAKAPDHLGPGVMLILRMPPPDGRWAEVYLSEQDRAALIAALTGADA